MNQKQEEKLDKIREEFSGSELYCISLISLGQG